MYVRICPYVPVHGTSEPQLEVGWCQEGNPAVMSEPDGKWGCGQRELRPGWCWGPPPCMESRLCCILHTARQQRHAVTAFLPGWHRTRTTRCVGGAVCSVVPTLALSVARPWVALHPAVSPPLAQPELAAVMPTSPLSPAVRALGLTRVRATGSTGASEGSAGADCRAPPACPRSPGGQTPHTPLCRSPVRRRTRLHGTHDAVPQHPEPGSR